MSKPNKRGDIRTWMLLVLALVPTWAVLVGAGWLWTVRGEEITEFEAAVVRVDTTYELFVVTNHVARAESSLHAAGLPGATDDVIARAQRDHVGALMSLRTAERTIYPLIGQLDPERDDQVDSEILELLSSSLSLGVEILERQVPGEPVDPQLTSLVGLARQTAAGIVLPLVNGTNAETGYLYDAMSTTIRYHDQFDRDRSAAIRLASNNVAPQADLIASPLRAAEWRDVIDSRTYTQETANLEWFSTAAAPDNPLVLDSTEPLGQLFTDIASPVDPQQWGPIFLAIQDLDDAIEADVNLAYSEIEARSELHLTNLLGDRRLTALTSCLMALLGLALAGLTISEVRRRRNVEAAHAEAMTLLGEKADRDPMTGLWNRRKLESVVPDMIASAPATNEIVVLAYIDLDHFKAINDVWGHSTGDHVLRTLTERLFDFSYRGIPFEICRFGGDEFVLYTQMPQRSLSWFEGLGTSIIEAVDSEMEVNGRLHGVGASVGIASSTPESTLDSLLLEADSSLILAKRDRGVAVVYNRDISRTGELVHALPSALTNGEICAHIQPVVDLASGAVTHVEALARWTRPNNENVSPGVFIPLVESYGLAEQLTTTVLGYVEKIINDPTTPDSIRVWVNVSPRELDVANFAQRFISMLRQLGVDPNRIGLEITETAAVDDPERLAVELRQLRAVGICVAIDDFGNGYSPLGYLRKLPVDVVKLDRSIISHIDTDIANQHLVVGIVGLVHELGMSIVAEGVERREEQAWLTEQGVSRVQGFLFDRPMSPVGFDWSERPLHANEPALLG